VFQFDFQAVEVFLQSGISVRDIAAGRGYFRNEIKVRVMEHCFPMLCFFQIGGRGTFKALKIGLYGLVNRNFDIISEAPQGFEQFQFHIWHPG
jgi:hypothetical protein